MVNMKYYKCKIMNLVGLILNLLFSHNFSEIEKIRISLCSDIQNKLHKSNPSKIIQAMGLRPPVKGSRPSSPPEGNYPIWGSKQVTWEREDGFISSRREKCETIARNASSPISKKYHQRPQDNQQERDNSN